MMSNELRTTLLILFYYVFIHVAKNELTLEVNVKIRQKKVLHLQFYVL